MPTIQLKDGCSLFYQFDGDATKPILMFSNPHGFTHHVWEPQVQGLADRFRILRYDFRGHGGSDVWNGPYSVERAARDVVELLEGLGLDKVFFCGLSIGGMVGIWLAANRPDLLAAAVLANTSLLLQPADHLKHRLAQIEKSGMGVVVDDIITRSLSENFRCGNPATMAKLESMIAGMSPEGYITGGRAVLEMDLRESPQHIHLPVLVITGSRDNSTPPAMGNAVADSIVDAKIANLDSAHLSNVERSTEFNQLLAEFLS